MNDQTEQTPTVPDGYYLLNTGEMIQNGDLRWTLRSQKWEIADVIGGQRVPTDRLYCRKK